MPRIPFAPEVGKAYHVGFKVANDEFRLVHDQDLKVLESYFVLYSNMHGVRITCYSIMSNHVHLLIENSDKFDDAITKFLRDSKREYAKFYNIAYGRKGTFWKEGNFYRLIDDEEQYLTNMAYILNNPVTAKRCKNAMEYAFGSFVSITDQFDLKRFKADGRFLSEEDARVIIKESKKIPYASRLPIEAQADRGLSCSTDDHRLKAMARMGRREYKTRGPKPYWHPMDPHCTVKTVDRFLCNAVIQKPARLRHFSSNNLREICHTMQARNENSFYKLGGNNILFESVCRDACIRYQKRYAVTLPDGALRENSITQTAHNTWVLLAVRGRPPR